MYHEKYFAPQLKKAMAFYNITTQAQLSDIIGVSRQVISLIVQGKRFPALNLVPLMANKLKLDVNFFFTGEEPERHITGLLDQEVFDIINAGCVVCREDRTVILYSRDEKKTGKYKQAFDRYKIIYHEVTSLYGLESIPQ